MNRVYLLVRSFAARGTMRKLIQTKSRSDLPQGSRPGMDAMRPMDSVWCVSRISLGDLRWGVLFLIFLDGYLLVIL